MEQLQLSIRLFAATMAAVFLFAIFVSRSFRDHERSATESALMVGFVMMATLAIIPELSGTFARFISEVGKLSTLPHPVTVPR